MRQFATTTNDERKGLVDQHPTKVRNIKVKRPGIRRPKFFLTTRESITALARDMRYGHVKGYSKKLASQPAS